MVPKQPISCELKEAECTGEGLAAHPDLKEDHWEITEEILHKINGYATEHKAPSNRQAAFGFIFLRAPLM